MLHPGEVQDLYKNRTVGLRIDYPDRPVHPLPTDVYPFCPDLREAINRLQFWCAQQPRSRSNSIVRTGDWSVDTSNFSTGLGEDRVARLGHLVDMHDLYQLERFADCESEIDSTFFSRADPELEVRGDFLVL
jgi:hypothetical protein